MIEVRRLIVLSVLGVVLVIAALVVADTIQPRTYAAYRDTVTINDLYSETAWDSITSVIVDRTDTAYVACIVTAQVNITPHDRLYIGFELDSNKVAVPEDTIVYHLDTYDEDADWQPITFMQKIDLPDGADADTIHLLAALGAGGKSVKMANIFVEAVVVDSAGL